MLGVSAKSGQTGNPTNPFQKPPRKTPLGVWGFVLQRRQKTSCSYPGRFAAGGFKLTTERGYEMGAKNPVVVSNLDEALGLVSGEFRGAECWIVAPLVDEKGGGRRSWYVLRLDEDGEPEGWIKESEAEAEGTDDPFKMPTVDMSADDLPTLPKSKVELWEVCFLDDKGKRMEPRVWIDPNAEPARETVRTARTEAKGSAMPEAESSRPSGENTSLGALLQALGISTRSNERMLGQMQGFLKTMADSVEQIGKGHAQLGQLYAANLEKSEQRAAKAEETRDMALSANLLLQNQLAEERAGGQGWITLREIYAQKPELLHDGIKDIASGVFAALRNALQNPDG